MCGEVAGDPKLIPILIGMGLDEFSMSPISVLRARAIIRNISQEKMKDLALQDINLPTAVEVEEFIEKNINSKH
jgi:phosphotransferase system enzyme I (PtsI)